MEIIPINTFSNINISQNTLILCDIDDTILKFDNINQIWWKNRFNYYYSLSNNYDDADLQVLNEWIDYIEINNPKFTDKNGFIKLLHKINKTNSEIIFITARESYLEKLTQKHFEYVNLSSFNYKIYHIGDVSKGTFINLNFDIEKYSNVIFIDDLDKNLESVYEIFQNKIIKYKFIY